MFSVDTIEATVLTGGIFQSIIDAIRISRHNMHLTLDSLGPIVTFKYNGTTIKVRSNSDADDICREYFRIRDAGASSATVGPYPPHISVDIKENTNLTHQDSRIPLEALAAIDAPHGENPDYGDPAYQPITGVL